MEDRVGWTISSIEVQLQLRAHTERKEESWGWIEMGLNCHGKDAGGELYLGKQKLATVCGMN